MFGRGIRHEGAKMYRGTLINKIVFFKCLINSRFGEGKVSVRLSAEIFITVKIDANRNKSEPIFAGEIDSDSCMELIIKPKNKVINFMYQTQATFLSRKLL